MSDPTLFPDEHDTVHAEDQLSPRARHLLLLGAVGLATLGFFIGIREPESGSKSLNDLRSQTERTGEKGQRAEFPTAPKYGERDASDASPNANFRTAWPPAPAKVDQLVPPPDGSDPIARDWTAALAGRNTRRAYAGAPPRVPHAVDQMRTESCLLCHQQGLAVGDVRAPKMSHGLFPNCTQCHVEDTNLAVEESPWAAAIPSEFAGLKTHGAGPRAMQGAPPQMPHPSWMREDCMSCHSNLGTTTLAVSHPWRSNCVQCHTPSAALDQRTVLPGKPR